MKWMTSMNVRSVENPYQRWRREPSCSRESNDQLRYRRHDRRVFLHAFDLIELDGGDLRRELIEARKAALAKLLRHAKAGLVLNEHINESGDVVFRASRFTAGCFGFLLLTQCRD